MRCTGGREDEERLSGGEGKGKGGEDDTQC